MTKVYENIENIAFKNIQSIQKYPEYSLVSRVFASVQSIR